MTETADRLTSRPNPRPNPCRTPAPGCPLRRSLVCGMIAALAVTSTLACGAAAAEGVPGEMGEAELRQAIAETYATLERLAAESGADLAFELGDFETHSLQDLYSLGGSDLQTFPDGVTIQGGLDGHSTIRDGELVGQEVTFQPRWEVREPQRLGPIEEQLGDSQRVGELIPLLAEGDARFHDLRGATSFRVHATLAGEARDYRAVVFRFEPPAATAASADPAGAAEKSLLFLDHVTSAAETAFRAVLAKRDEPEGTRPAASP